MIRVRPVPEPGNFQAKCGNPGRRWLKGHPGACRPKDYWSPFKTALADGFTNLCGYCAMYCPVGSVDHYLSWHEHPEGAYDWDNYRFAEEWMNKSKQNADERVLDPFEVRDGWFEILLPSLELVVTDSVPAGKRRRAEYTLTRLHLRDDERVLRQRQGWLQMYRDGKLTLDGLQQVAPLIAVAVRKQQS